MLKNEKNKWPLKKCILCFIITHLFEYDVNIVRKRDPPPKKKKVQSSYQDFSFSFNLNINLRAIHNLFFGSRSNVQFPDCCSSTDWIRQISFARRVSPNAEINLTIINDDDFSDLSFHNHF